LTPLPEVELKTLLDESAVPVCIEKADIIIGLNTKINNLNVEESRIHTSREALVPWEKLALPLEKTSTATCSVSFGVFPISQNLAEAVQQMHEAASESELFEVSADKSMRYCMLVAMKDQMDKAVSALRQHGWSAVNISGYSGTAVENIAAFDKRLAELEVERNAVIAELAALGGERFRLQLGLDTLSNLIAGEEDSSKLLNTSSSFTFTGWVTKPNEDELNETLSKYDCAWDTTDPLPEEYPSVPVKLKNNIFTAPFNMVTEMYSMPAYNGLDPNPWIAPFFALFFGMMYGDMAYGLILLVAGLLLTFKAKPKGGMKNMAGLLIIGGTSTAIIGFFTGGFFGDLIPQIGKWFGQSWVFPFHMGALSIGNLTIEFPFDIIVGNNPLFLLIFAICLGVIHLAVGVGLGMYLKIRDGQWADALLNDLCWWVMFVGIGLMVLGFGKTVLFIGIAMLVLGVFLTNKGFKRITGLFGAIYNGATGYLGDFLSYSRLMALMLAGAVIASVFNQLGSLGNANGMTLAGTILFVIVFIIGHALNFALNLIGCFVHTLRLQFLEFFGKWYRDGGKKFRPLAVQSKYVNVKEE
ncbi:MAG: V-type ATP synthase subunit I, partial [Oscillospiraceae bacterium]|nr:V-type ATP synthase subunit I [Oscillospiraceae bacterium]